MIVLKVLFCKRLETSGEGDESGSTATTIFVRDDALFISHVGDSCVVCLQHFIFTNFMIGLCNRGETRVFLEVLKMSCFLNFPPAMQALSRSGKTEVLTDSHRPYGNNKVSLQEIRRIREAGGWVCFPMPFSLTQNSFILNVS